MSHGLGEFSMYERQVAGYVHDITRRAGLNAHFECECDRVLFYRTKSE